MISLTVGSHHQKKQLLFLNNFNDISIFVLNDFANICAFQGV